MKLHEQVKVLKDRIKELEDNNADILRYINSKKFRCGDKLDGYVNVSDIRNYIMNVWNTKKGGEI